MKKLFALVLAVMMLSLAGSAMAAGSVVVYSPHDADPLAAGVAMFQAAYPDIQVEVIAGGTGELAQRIHRDPSTVTALVGKLRKLGYVEVSRSDADKRVSIVCLSEKGRGFRGTFESISEELASKLACALSDGEREQLDGILQKLHDEYQIEGNGR